MQGKVFAPGCPYEDIIRYAAETVIEGVDHLSRGRTVVRGKASKTSCEVIDDLDISTVGHRSMIQGATYLPHRFDPHPTAARFEGSAPGSAGRRFR